MPKTEAQRAWERANRQKVKDSNARYEARNRADRRHDKMMWWREHKGSYGSRANWRAIMKDTYGIGLEAYWQKNTKVKWKKGGRPKGSRRKAG